MHRRGFLCAAAAAAGCAGRRPEEPLEEISVALSEHLSVSAMHLAEEGGFLREAGFRMKVVGLSAHQAIPLLAGGKIDVILGGVPSPLLNAVLRGMNVRVVAGREYVNPSCGTSYALYVRREAFAGGPIEPRRLKGRRFAVRSRGITEFVLDSFLRGNGMALDDVERVDLPLRESLTALAGRKIDGMCDAELSRSPLAISPDIVTVWRLSDTHPFHQYSFIAFGDSMLRGGLERGARFLAAYLQAAGEFLDGRTPRFMREFASRNGLDVEQTVAECRETFPRDGAIDAASLQRSIDWNVEKGYATAPLQASQLIDASFLEEARRLLKNGRWPLRSA